MQKSNWAQSALASVRELAETKKAVSATSTQDTQTALNELQKNKVIADTILTSNSANNVNLQNLKLQNQKSEQEVSKGINDSILKLMNGIKKTFGPDFDRASSAYQRYKNDNKTGYIGDLISP